MTEDDDAWLDMDWDALLNAPMTYCPLRDEIEEWDLRRMRADDLAWLDTDEDET